jgi:hypothetical protein
MKVTVPVGVPGYSEFTVAVTVSEFPELEGLVPAVNASAELVGS